MGWDIGGDIGLDGMEHGWLAGMGWIEYLLWFGMGVGGFLPFLRFVNLRMQSLVLKQLNTKDTYAYDPG